MLKMGKKAYLELIVILNDLSSAVVDRHRPLREPVFLFELSIHQEYRFARLWWALLECLLEQIARPF